MGPSSPPGVSSKWTSRYPILLADLTNELTLHNCCAWTQPSQQGHLFGVGQSFLRI